jgi:hypothetical protein
VSWYLGPPAAGVRAWRATHYLESLSAPRSDHTGTQGAHKLGGAGVLAVVYFLAAQLGLALLSMPFDVAAFWPASGIAADILIIAGRRARSSRVLLGCPWLQNGSYRRKLAIDWREIVGASRSSSKAIWLRLRAEDHGAAGFSSVI